MKSKVCHIANGLKGMSRSEAFRKAWAMVKIESLAARRFALNMKDRWDASDRAEDSRLSSEIATLFEHGKTAAEKKADEDARIAVQAEIEREEAVELDVWAKQQEEFEAYQQAKFERMGLLEKRGVA